MRPLLRITPTLAITATIACLFSACSDDLQASPERAADAGNAVPGAADAEPGNSHISHTPNSDGTTTTTIDATSQDAWIYLDLATQAQVSPSAPSTSQTWDLAFRRVDISLNGGISGEGNVGALAIPDAEFDTLQVAPGQGYATDLTDGDDDDMAPDLYFGTEEGTWYDYNPKTHVLTAKSTVFVVQSVEGDYYKLRFLDYYDSAGTGGHVTFQWGPLESPSHIQSFTVDASAPEAWVYLDMSDGQLVDVLSPETHLGWDLAVRRTSFRSNSGTSGSGAGGVLEIEQASLEDVLTAPTSGYVVDALLPIPGPPGSGEESGNASLATWYDYNPTTHLVSPRSTNYVVRTSDGNYSRIRIRSYDDGLYQIDWSSAGEQSVDF